MLTTLIDALFGCSHTHTTFPLTPRNKHGKRQDTRVICLDCGQEFAYSWSEMRVTGPLKAEERRGQTVEAGETA
jgi:predicted protein tyrosine phosphatase